MVDSVQSHERRQAFLKWVARRLGITWERWLDTIQSATEKDFALTVAGIAGLVNDDLMALLLVESRDAAPPESGLEKTELPEVFELFRSSNIEPELLRYIVLPTSTAMNWLLRSGVHIYLGNIEAAKREFSLYEQARLDVATILAELFG